MDTSLDDIIAKMTALLREAYDAGQQEAVRRMLTAVGAPTVGETGKVHFGEATLRGQATLKVELPALPGKRARSGAVKTQVLELIKSRPEGISEPQINEALADLNRSSRYMAVRSLLEDRKVERRGGLLFPATVAEEPGGDAPGPITPKPEELL